MRTETITKTYLTFDELNDDQKKKVVENWDNDGDLYEYHMQERIATLEAFAKRVDATLDYSLSCVPDRGEFIRLTPKTDELETLKLVKEFANSDEYGSNMLIGVCYDDDLKDFVKSGGLFNGLEKYIDDIHNEYESMLTVEYIGELCEANDYEFDSETLELI